MRMASIICLKLISCLLVLAVSISVSTAYVGDDTASVDPIETRIRVSSVSMLVADENLPGQFDTIMVNIETDRGHLVRMGCYWPNAESYSPRLSKSQAITILDRLEPDQHFGQDKPIIFYFDKDASIPQLLADEPRPTPFTVEDFPWQLDHRLTDDQRRRRYNEAEIDPFVRSLYIDTDFELNVLARIEGHLFEGQVTIPKSHFRIEASTPIKPANNPFGYFARNSDSYEIVLRG